MNKLKINIVLASKSPRRIEILLNLGIHPEVIPADIDEDIGEFRGDPEMAVKVLAERKARAVYSVIGKRENTVIMAADTLVYKDKRLLGKPSGEKEAREILKFLSDSTHSVYTGVAIEYNGKFFVDCVESKVHFKKLDRREIDWYIATGEPFDKAGGYGIQGKGAVLADSIEGDYFNVVGLPVSRIFTVMKNEFCLGFEMFM